MDFDDFIYLDVPQEERESTIDYMSDGKEEGRWFEKYSPAELAQKEHEYAELNIKLKVAKEELEKAREKFKLESKPVISKMGDVIDLIKAGGESVDGMLYKQIDFERGRVGLYNGMGKLINVRPIMPDERQTNILNINKKSKTVQ